MPGLVTSTESLIPSTLGPEKGGVGDSGNQTKHFHFLKRKRKRLELLVSGSCMDLIPIGATFKSFLKYVCIFKFELVSRGGGGLFRQRVTAYR